MTGRGTTAARKKPIGDTSRAFSFTSSISEMSREIVMTPAKKKSNQFARTTTVCQNDNRWSLAPPDPVAAIHKPHTVTLTGPEAFRVSCAIQKDKNANERVNATSSFVCSWNSRLLSIIVRAKPERHPMRVPMLAAHRTS